MDGELNPVTSLLKNVYLKYLENLMSEIRVRKYTTGRSLSYSIENSYSASLINFLIGNTADGATESSSKPISKKVCVNS